MNVTELLRAIDQSKKRLHFSIRSIPQPHLLPDDAVIMEPSVEEPDKWVVYYADRRQTWNHQIFDNEEAACGYVYAILAKPESPPTREPLTVEEQKRVATQLQEAEHDVRELLIAVGRDPETGNPV